MYKKLVCIILSAVMMFSLSGCVSGEITEVTNKDTTIHIPTDTNIIETNKEEKQAFYDNFLNGNNLKMYGNTTKIYNDGQYIQLSMVDMKMYAEISPMYKQADKEINIKVISDIEEGNIQNYIGIEVVAGNEKETFWIDVTSDKTDENMNNLADSVFDASNNAKNGFAELIQTVIMATDAEIEYIQTSAEGIDTIKIIKGEEILVVRLNPETNEIHSFTIGNLDNEVAYAAEFLNEDYSVKNPKDAITEKWKILYLALKYLQN